MEKMVKDKGTKDRKIGSVLYSLGKKEDVDAVKVVKEMREGDISP